LDDSADRALPGLIAGLRTRPGRGSRQDRLQKLLQIFAGEAVRAGLPERKTGPDLQLPWSGWPDLNRRPLLAAHHFIGFVIDRQECPSPAQEQVSVDRRLSPLIDYWKEFSGG
jgi:hypothetical protein